MVKFSCKTISKEDLIKCAFALNKTDYKLLMFLLNKDKSLTTKQISGFMGLDRTTVQKAASHLVSKRIVKRRQKNIPGGGYTFLYSIGNKEEVKSKIKEVVRNWCEGIEDAINEI